MNLGVASNLKIYLLKLIPSIAKLAAAKKKASTRAVSGTAPTLSSIPGLDIPNLFWSPGVIDAIAGGSPSENQCHQFYGSANDGESGGFGACFMAQGIGYSFEPVLQSGVSLCYMQNAPTQAVLDAGGVGLISGEFPDNKITKLFNPPTGSESRLVRATVQIGALAQDEGNQGQEEEEEEQEDTDTYIRVYPATGNILYKVDLWHCRAGDSQTYNYEQMSISKNGTFSSFFFDQARPGETFQSVVSAKLNATANGKVSFNTSQTRRANINNVSDGRSFKGSIEITPNSLIKTKSYDTEPSGFSRKAYTVSSYNGNDLTDLQFNAGAYSDSVTNSDQTTRSSSGATEYRDSYYAAAPDSNLISQLDDVNLSTDSFYSTPEITGDPSQFPCGIEGDITVFIDPTNSAFQAIAAACETTQLDGMDFCWSNASVDQAQNNFFTACNPGNGP